MLLRVTQKHQRYAKLLHGTRAVCGAARSPFLDGSRFKAANTRDKNLMPGAIRPRMGTGGPQHRAEFGNA